MFRAVPRNAHLWSGTCTGRLTEERKDKLLRASRLIREWDALKIRPSIGWKQWVHSADRTISPKWLTRAANPNPKIGYGLKLPKKRSR